VKGSGEGPDGPEDVDAAFAEIVAGLEREGVGVGVPIESPRRDSRDTGRENGPEGLREDTDEPDRKRTSQEPQAEEPSADPRATVWRGHGDWDWSWHSDDEHYQPPEPPPLPRPRPLTVIALALLVIGVVLLVAPTLLAVSARVATPIALISLTVGIGLVVLRIRRVPPPETDRDDGAQV
jgi:hypothetical protein